MNKVIRKAALSILLALFAAVLCLLTTDLLHNKKVDIAEAAGTTTATLSLTDMSGNAVSIVAPGQQFKLKLHTTTTLTGYNVSSLAFYLGMIDTETGKATAKDVNCLEYVAGSITHNLATYQVSATYNEVPSTYVEGASAAKFGMQVVVSTLPSTTPISCTDGIDIEVTLKVKDDADAGGVTFGIAQANTNKITYVPSAGGTTKTELFVKDIPITPFSVVFGTVSDDADLKTIAAGHGSASNSITPAETMETVADAESRTDFKVKVTKHEKAKVLYGVDTPDDPVTKLADDGIISIPTLNSSGLTVVKLQITAEDGTTVKNYTLNIKSGYVRLSKITASVTPSDITGMGLVGTFNKETFTYTVKVPSNYTAVTIKPEFPANYGMQAMSATSTGCKVDGATSKTNIATGAVLNITDITNNSTLVIKPKAYNNTEKPYTITFEVADADNSISSFTMTAANSDTVNSSASKATAAGVDYYFLLTEEQQFKGTFNITTGSTSSSTTVKVGGTAYNASTQYSAQATAYNVVVTPPAGNAKTYKVMVAKKIEAASFKTLEYSVGTSAGTYTNVLTHADFDADTKTFTLNLTAGDGTSGTYNPTTAKFFLKGTFSEGASVKSTNNISGSGTTTWTGNGALALGTKTMTVTLKSSDTSLPDTDYSFVITLKEDKYNVTAIRLYKQINTATPTLLPSDKFTFSEYTTSYNFDLDYEKNCKIVFEVDVDGLYTVLPDAAFVKKSGTQKTYTYTAALVPGTPVTLKVQGVADSNQTGANKGTEYNFTIGMDAADTNTVLQSLAVKIDGVSYDFKENGGVFNPNSNTWSVEFEKTTANSTSAIVIDYALPTGSRSNVTVGGNMTFTYAAGESTQNYTVKVDAQDGSSSNTYNISIKRVIPPPEFKTLEISYDIGGSNIDVLGAAEYNATTKTYTIRKSIADVPVQSNKIYVSGTITADALASATGLDGSLTAGWSKALAYGTNSYTLNVTASGKPTATYKLNITLYEDKNTITDVTFKKDGKDIDSNFSFSSGGTKLEVPFVSPYTITMTVFTDGDYVKVTDTTNNKQLTRGTGSKTKEHTLGISINPGITTIRVEAKSDEGNGTAGSSYTFTIEMEKPDDNAKLSDLVVTIGGEIISFKEGAFDPDTTAYTYDIIKGSANSVPIVITPTAQSDKVKSVVVKKGSTTLTDGKSDFTFRTSTYDEVYTVEIMPETNLAADKKTYTFTIHREYGAGDFTDILYSKDGGSSYDSIFESFTASGSAKKLATINLSTDDFTVGDKLYFKVVKKPETKANKDSSLTKEDSGVESEDIFSGTVNFGKNDYMLLAQLESGTTKMTYQVTVNLSENNDRIKDIKIIDFTGNKEGAELDSFSFYVGTMTYNNITVPSSVAQVKVVVTPDGEHADVYDSSKKSIKLSGVYKFEKVLQIQAGGSVEDAFYAVANDGSGINGNKETGDKYSIKIARDQLNADTTLKSLIIKVNNVAVDLFDPNSKLGLAFNPGLSDYLVLVEQQGSATSLPIKIEAVAENDKSTVVIKQANRDVTKDNLTYTFVKDQEGSVTYEIEVTAEDGTKSIPPYTVTIMREILEGDLATFEFAERNAGWDSVFTSSRVEVDGSVYTLKLSTDKVSVDSKFRFKAIPTTGAALTVSKNLTAGNNNEYSADLKLGANEFTFTASSTNGSKEYTFIVNLCEEKNTIENIVITTSGKTLDTSLFKFSKGTYDYEFSVPYTVESLKFAVTTDGVYTVVTDEAGMPFTKTSVMGTTHEKTYELSEGGSQIIRFRAVSDTEESGDWYRIAVTRESASDDATLKTLEVRIGGKVVPFDDGVEFYPTVYEYFITYDGSSSTNVNIKAEANNAKTVVSGDANKPLSFRFTDGVTAQNYHIQTKAESGDELEYIVTISQKPYVPDSTYDLNKITIIGETGTVYYDDLPADMSEPIQLEVDPYDSKVKIDATAVIANKTKVNYNPKLSANGYLNLTEEEYTQLHVYGEAEDGTNSDGTYGYIFMIYRPKAGDPSSSVDAKIDITGWNGESSKNFAVNASSETVLISEVYPFNVNKADMTVEISEIPNTRKGTYSIVKIADGGKKDYATSTSETKTYSLDLNFGINVYCVNIISSDKKGQKTVVFVMEREAPALEWLGAKEISALANDFDPTINDYSYSVDSDISSLTLDIQADTSSIRWVVEGADDLQYGMNQVTIKLYEKSKTRAANDEPLRVITLNVFRKENTLFWTVMFWILVALAVIELIIVLLVSRSSARKRAPEEPAVIVTNSPAVQPAQQSQPTIIVQQNPNDYQ